MHPTLRKTLLLLVLAAVTAAAWWRPLDAATHRQVEAGLQRSLASFAAARAIGAVLAVAQGTQVAAQPAGIGVVLAPGQALKPVAELVEQFAALMLAASVAFGVQLLLASIGAHWAVSALLTAALLAWVVLRWRRAPAAPAPRPQDDAFAASSAQRRTDRWLAPVLVALLLARFGIPVLAAGNEAVFHAVMAPTYTAAQAGLGQAVQSVPALVQPDRPPPARDEGWIDGFKRRLPSGLPDLADLGQRADRLLAVASQAVDHVVRLIAVFVLQTLVLPLVFLWLLRRLCGLALRA